MKDLTIATFISNNEKCNLNFFEFCNKLKEKLDIEIIIFTDKKIDVDENIAKQIIKNDTTKYKRIIQLIEISNSNNIICIDNDITINHEKLKGFIKQFISNDNDLAWGKIKALPVKGIVPNLIVIDKNLSHDLIRPFLWKIGLGISVPGQIFMIKKERFYEVLPKIDTVYDDLTIGMVARKNGFKVYQSKDVLGEELPKGNFRNLIKQRARWAKGLAQSIKNGKKMKMLKFVLIHGFMYHMLWIIYYLILTLITAQFSVILSSIIFLLTAIVLSEFKIKKFLWAITYMVIFPFVHIIWFGYLIKNLHNTN